MKTKELLKEITDHLQLKYAASGLATADQVDGVHASAVRFGMRAGEKTLSFKIVITELPRRDL